MTRQMNNAAGRADSIIISSYSGEPTKIRAPSHQSSSWWVTNLEGNMKQQKLDLLIYPAQPFKHWTEFYESNSAIQSAWSPRAFLYLIKKNIEFFGDAVVNVQTEIFLRESFLGRLSLLLPGKRLNNLHKAR